MNLLNEDNLLQVELDGLYFKNPILVASGTFGYGQEYEELINLDKLGGIITKTITLEPKKGNSPPRVRETSCGLLNSIGLQNEGLKKFLDTKIPKLKGISTNVIVSIGGSEVSEFKELVEELDKVDEIDALEINLSCPNIIYEMTDGFESEGKRLIAQDVFLTFEVVRTVRKVTNKIIIPKLSPNVTDIIPIARSCYDAGADALTIANTHLGMAVDIERRKTIFENIKGGLSGPAVKPLILRLVWEVHQEIDLPIIASGGIITGEDATEFIITGANIVSVGTGTFINPKAALEIRSYLENYMKEKDIKSIKELSGSIKI